jgi:4-hydroxyphenylacetate 3-monooxygenase
MLRTGADYLRALRDGRKVYLGKELVTDVTTHPAFRNTARAFADLYDRKRSPENVDALSYEADGERHSFWFLQPRTRDDLRSRAIGHRQVARWSYGLLGRSPDLVSSLISGLAMDPSILEGNRTGFGENLVAFYKQMRRDDLFSSYVMIAAKAARRAELYSRPGKSAPALHVVKETDAGVVLRGAKLLGTASVFSDLVWVGNLFPLAPDQSPQAVTCVVPTNALGLSIWARKPFEQYALGLADNPFSSRFDESDSVLIFEDVHVPWDRVFLLDDAALSRDIYFRTPAHVMSNHQSVVRFLEKLRMMLGIAYKTADINALLEVPAVRETLSKLAAAEASLKGLISGSIEDAETTSGGYMHVNRRELYAALYWCTNNYTPIAEVVRELLGVGPFQMPADSSFFEDDDLRDKFDHYWASANSSARERKKFIRLAWDYLGSEFAGRHAQYERFYAGPQFVHTLYNYANCRWDDYKTAVDEVMAEIPDTNDAVGQPS